MFSKMECKTFFKYFFLVILLYLYLNNPVFSVVGIGSIKFFYLLIPFTFIGKKFSSVIRLFRREKMLFIALVVFSLIRTVLGGDIMVVYTHITFFIENFLVAISLVVLISDLGFTNEQLNKSCMIVGCVGAIISMMCILNESICDYVRYQLMDTAKDSLLYTVTYRGFGLSDSLSYGYGIIQACLFVMCVYYLKQNKWAFLFYIPLLASIMLNARTGIVVFAACIVYMLICSRKFSVLLSVVIGVSSLIYLAPILLPYLGLSEDTLRWLLEFQEEMEGVADSGSIRGSGTADALLGRMVVLPSDFFEWIIGRGYIIFLTKGPNSDVGFFQQLNYGGLSYVTILSLLFIAFYKRMKQYRIDVFFIGFFFITFLIANLKGNYIFECGAFRFMLLLYFFYIYSAHRNIYGRFKTC